MSDIWEVRPCKDRLGHITSYDICLPQEPGTNGVAVIASVYSGEEVAQRIVALWNAASGTLTEGGDVKQAPSTSLSGPTTEGGDAQ